MKLDGAIPTDITTAAEGARRLETLGYTAGFTAETTNDPFLPLAVAATATERLELGTSIAVAFARNPMTLANIGHDLQKASKGRFTLGLGSQIKPHITKRFSMPWSSPAARMREMILALHAIWARWNDGVDLAFRGEFYRHTLMTPMFDPGPTGYGRPRVILAGVGPQMTAVAGEVADGFISHAFTTPEYFRDVTVPAIEAGLTRAGRSRAEFEISMPAFVVTGDDDAAIAHNSARTRQQIAFYGSTPAYRSVLEHHGWGDAQGELNRLSKLGKWVEMGDLIDDTMLRTFAIVGPPEALPSMIAERFGGHLDRIMFHATVDRTKADRWGPILDGIRAI